MKYSKFLLAAAVILIIASLYGCSLTTKSTKMVTPEIRALGLPDISAVESITLRVSGPDMDTVEVNYDIVPSVINLAIPEGNNITFELSVKLSAAAIALSPNVATSYKGTATSDISSDSAVVTLNMGVASTKIIVPDPEWFGAGPEPRIIQFDDISDNSGTVLTGAQLAAITLDPSWATNFYPYDIDFDSQGRIYIANNNGTNDVVIRVDNITGFGFKLIEPLEESSGIIALTVDRKNNLLYFTDGTNIYSSDLNGSNEKLLPDTNSNNVAGMAVDAEDDYLYFVHDPEGSYIAKYSLKLETVVNDTNSDLWAPWDIVVKEDKLLVANISPNSGEQILEFSTSDLILTGQYGSPSVTSPDLSIGKFYGPRRFAAQINDEITIVDDSQSEPLDKIVQMDNIYGDNWKTLPVNSDGQALFMFFTPGIVPD